MKRQFQNLLVRPSDIEPSEKTFEVIGTFNPGATEYQGEVLLLVRVAEQLREQRFGWTSLPCWEDGQITADWIRDSEIDAGDPRVIRLKQDGLLRLTFTSHLRVMRSRDGRTIDQWDAGRLNPQEPWEEYGLEDPRIVRLGERYWITYVAVSRHGAATALASTSDFVSFERHGIIFCPENKDVVLFPEQIGGQYYALHRPTTAHSFCRPEMWVARSPDLIHWGQHQPLHGGEAAWESDRVGAGTPPVKTEKGWLEIYHASRSSGVPGVVGTYAAGAMLLDSENPARIIGKSPGSLWEPSTDYELSGFVPRVVFPTGIVVRGDLAQLYYGASDTYTAMLEFSIADLPLR